MLFGKKWGYYFASFFASLGASTVSVARSLLTADRPAVNLELRAVARRLDDQNVVLDADYAADKTTDGGNLITDLDGVTHIALLFVALALRTDQEKVEYDDQNYKRQNCAMIAP